MEDDNGAAGVPRCTRHPDRETLLTCTRCDRPMCPDCLVPAAVGMQCVDCVRGSAKEEPKVARELTVARRRARRPGWVFWTLVAVFLALCVALTRFSESEVMFGDVSSGLKAAAFLTVLVGWVISLCIHEWAHAYVAYRSGDHSVVGKGYLNLDPRKYVDPVFSLVFPILFLLMGGIGLPGGAVWIDHGNIRSRASRSLVSAAGPAVNLVFGVVCVVVAQRLLVDWEPLLGSTIMYLGFIQFATALLNLLPIPGLDGFGIIAPYLPYQIRNGLMAMSSMIIMLLLVIVISRPGSMAFLFDGATNLVERSGGHMVWVALGQYIGDIQLR